MSRAELAQVQRELFAGRTAVVAAAAALDGVTSLEAGREVALCKLWEEPVNEVLYLRFQSTTPSQRGTFPGVFGLVNGLAREGKLTAEQELFRKINNAWYEANFTDPSSVDPTVYDRTINPKAAAWFKPSALEMVERVDGYLEILAEHDIDCELIRSADPGRVIYEDEHQIVVVPYT
ncbi:MAG TPA: hypothetical protein VFX60_08530 [Micromonospora sp.]|nr:hypothetical protein [Micromonospora sp.]